MRDNVFYYLNVVIDAMTVDPGSLISLSRKLEIWKQSRKRYSIQVHQLSAVHTTRVYGPWTRAVNTGSVYRPLAVCLWCTVTTEYGPLLGSYMTDWPFLMTLSGLERLFRIHNRVFATWVSDPDHSVFQCRFSTERIRQLWLGLVATFVVWRFVNVSWLSVWSTFLNITDVSFRQYRHYCRLYSRYTTRLSPSHFYLFIIIIR